MTFVQQFRAIVVEIPCFIADSMDRWVMGMHAGTDIGTDDEPWRVCTWHGGAADWPCKDYMAAAERIASRHGD